MPLLYIVSPLSGSVWCPVNNLPMFWKDTKWWLLRHQGQPLIGRSSPAFHPKTICYRGSSQDRHLGDTVASSHFQNGCYHFLCLPTFIELPLVTNFLLVPTTSLQKGITVPPWKKITRKLTGENSLWQTSGMSSSPCLLPMQQLCLTRVTVTFACGTS